MLAPLRAAALATPPQLFSGSALEYADEGLISHASGEF
jgi:hypothetical protein